MKPVHKVTSIHPVHRSVLNIRERAMGRRPRPVGMSVVAMPSEAREAVEQIAIGIFTDMVNSGATFQESLAAIYLSGADHGRAVSEEERPASPKTAEDLACLVRRLSRALRKAAPESDLPGRAIDYLGRIGLEGSPLRSRPSQDQLAGR